ncbi:MAG TPA: MFS transporter [Thermoanaerobaculia bacterium]|nr:MFS transporter [Thermoanaerobaculia bacterium]
MSSKRSKPHPLRALRHRNFQLFFAGQLISLIGTWMQQVAQSWLLYRLTRSSLLLGGISFAGQIPIFLLGALGGHVADQRDRRRILVATQTASMILAFILAALTLTHVIHEWHLFVLAALLGIVNAFDIPTRQAFLVEMVTREDLINAIALNSSMFNGARIVGPAVAGLIVAAIGEGWCFFANAVSYIAVIAGLLMMRVAPFTPQRTSRSMWANIAEGFSFAAKTAPVRALLVLIGVVSFTALPYSVLMPVFADQIFHSGARGLGILMGAAGAGALCGSMLLATRASVRGLGRWVAAACALAGVALFAFSFSRNFALSAAILLFAGCAMMVQMASSNTLIQSMVPDALRGRVMALYSMMFMGMGPLGALVAGSIAQRAGAPMAVAAGGAITFIAAVAFAIRLPALREPARQLILAQQAAPGEPAQQTTATGAE